MFISIFSKNWRESQLPCPCRGKQLRDRQKELSIWQLLLSFLLNCGVQLSAETAVIWSCLSDREMGGNIRISLKTSAIDVQSARVFPIRFFRLHYDTRINYFFWKMNKIFKQQFLIDILPTTIITVIQNARSRLLMRKWSS